MSKIIYQTNLDYVDWTEMKTILRQDNFDNGRSHEQLKTSFENSYAVCIAYANNRIIGTARALLDGICNAYLVDIWTKSAYRHQGIATKAIENLLSRLQGQHVYLFTDDAFQLYQKLGFVKQPVGMGKVVGKWLENNNRID